MASEPLRSQCLIMKEFYFDFIMIALGYPKELKQERAPGSQVVIIALVEAGAVQEASPPSP